MVLDRCIILVPNSAALLRNSQVKCQPEYCPQRTHRILSLPPSTSPGVSQVAFTLKHHATQPGSTSNIQGTHGRTCTLGALLRWSACTHGGGTPACYETSTQMDWLQSPCAGAHLEGWEAYQFQYGACRCAKPS